MRRKTHRSSRLVLRPLRLSDYRTWFEAYAEGLPPKNEWDRAPLAKRKCTLEIYKKIVLRHRKMAREDRCYVYGVFHQSTLVGMVDIGIHERGSLDFANLGYLLFNRYWGKGFAQEAVRVALKIGHKDLKLQRLEASIDLKNRRSQKLVRNLGLEREGIKKAYWFQNGKWEDQVIFVSRL